MVSTDSLQNRCELMILDSKREILSNAAHFMKIILDRSLADFFFITLESSRDGDCKLLAVVEATGAVAS